MPGAAILASRAALHAGAGLVTLASEATLNPPDEIMRATYSFDDSFEQTVDALSAKADVLLVGPGLPQNDHTLRIVQAVRQYQKPLVLDAGALWAISQMPENTEFRSRDLFMTPHIGEASRILDIPTTEVSRDPGKYALEIAKKYRANVILKAHVTHIATSKPSLALLPYPNPAMASAGIGDVLSGILAAIAAQARGNAFVRWVDVAGIAAVAVSTHSKAGRRVAQNHSVVTAGDLIQNIIVG